MTYKDLHNLASGYHSDLITYTSNKPIMLEPYCFVLTASMLFTLILAWLVHSLPLSFCSSFTYQKGKTTQYSISLPSCSIFLFGFVYSTCHCIICLFFKISFSSPSKCKHKNRKLINFCVQHLKQCLAHYWCPINTIWIKKLYKTYMKKTNLFPERH